jgi:general secretion pathway protein B
VLLINAALLVALLWPKHAPDPPVPEVAERPVPPAVVYQPRSAPPAPVTPPSEASSVAGPALTRQAVAPEQVTASAPRRAVPPVAALRPLPPLPEPERPDAVGTVTGAAADSGNHVTKNRVDAVSPAAESRYNNLPVWPQISGQLLSELNGTLHLDVHVFSETPGERFVLINMRKYRQGETLQEGPVVDDITPDSVILSFRGQRFRMQSQ